MNEDAWFNRKPAEDDPALVAFEAAIRRRNVIVYLIGGLVSLPIGAFFAILGWSIDVGHRIVTMGLLMFMTGVACIIQSWRLAHGAPMTSEEGEEADPPRERRRVVKAYIGVAIGGLLAGAVVIAIGQARNSTTLTTTGTGLILGALVCVQRAWAASRRQPDE